MSRRPTTPSNEPVLRIPGVIEVVASAINGVRIVLGPSSDEIFNSLFAYILIILPFIVPNLDTLSIIAHDVIWTTTLQRLLEENLPASVKVYWIRIIDPSTHSELVVLKRNTFLSHIFDFSSLTIPTTFFDHEISYATLGLSNLRVLHLLAPTIPHEFHSIKDALLVRVLYTLAHVRTLQKLAVSVDFLGQTADIIHAASSQQALQVIELLMPTTFELTWITKRLISNALTGGLEQYIQLTSLTIPLDLLSPQLIAALGRLPRLRVLKVKSTLNVSPGPTFLGIIQASGILPTTGFHSLDILDLNLTSFYDNRSRAAILTRFHNIRII